MLPDQDNKCASSLTSAFHSILHAHTGDIIGAQSPKKQTIMPLNSLLMDGSERCDVELRMNFASVHTLLPRRFGNLLSKFRNLLRRAPEPDWDVRARLAFEGP